MSEQMLTPKVHASGLIEVGELALSKKTTEILLAPVIGNGTVTSGLIKGVGGIVIYNEKSQARKIIGGGLVFDAIEDVIQGLFGPAIEQGLANITGKITGGRSNQNKAWWTS